MKKIAISQSNYIPWKGYFDMINMVDEFILYDTMQYTKRDWRNRNKIKTTYGSKWLSIPIEVKGKYLQKINEARISEENWGSKHWQSIEQNYKKSQYFHLYKDIFEELYLHHKEEYLSKINYNFIVAINSILGITTPIRFSNEFSLEEGKTEKILAICKACNADIYLSGPAAQDYFDVTLAEKEGIQIEWMDYNNYKEYNQHYPPFEHNVSILDLIFNEGPNAHKYMKSFTIQ